MGLSIISPPAAGGGGGGANLTRTLAASQVTINSDTGTDAIIPAADGTNAGVMTSAMQVKLAGIATGADVTAAANVGSSIHGATAKTTPVDADTLPLIDSAASNVLKKVTWANIKATLKAYFDTFYSTFTNPMSASGDIIYGGTAGAATRLAKGTDGKVLTLDSGLPSWQTPSAGGTISTPKVYYVETTGNDGTGAVGNPALPYATGTAAYNAGVAAGVYFTIKFGAGGHVITRTSDLSLYFVQAIGCGRDITNLTINGSPADDVAGSGGYATTLNISHLNLYISALGGNATGTSGEAGGNGGNVTIHGSNSILDIGNISGGNSVDGNGGGGGSISISGDIKLISILANGGTPGGAGSPGSAGAINVADGCYLVGCVYNGVTAYTFARCSYTSADITPSSALACAAY